jgi:hypothetical protein
MSSENKSSNSAFSILGLPAILISIFALFGIQLNPNGGNASNQSSTKNEPKEASMASILHSDPLKFIEANKPPTDREILEILDPLVRYRALDLYKYLCEAFDSEVPKQENHIDNTVEFRSQTPKQETSIVAKIINKFQESNGEKKRVDNLESCLLGLLTNDIKLQTIIEIVPDPIYSGMSYHYDKTILGITKGMTDEDYLLDSFTTNWKLPESNNDSKSDKSLSKNESEPSYKNWIRKPGMILFRKYENPSKEFSTLEKTAAKELVVILLVPETPIEGIDISVMAKALHVADRLKSSCEKPIRIVGPTFSGSYSSVQRIIQYWEKKDNITWYNGEASIFGNNEQQSYIKNLIPTGSVLKEALISYIKSDLAPSCITWNKRVAILSEEKTAWGKLLESKEAPDSNSNETKTPNDICYENNKLNEFYFNFPLRIDQIRLRVQQLEKQSISSTGIKLQNQEGLTLDIDEAGQHNELLPLADTTFTSVNEELRLLKVVSEINRLNIRFIILTASDIRDKIFLIKYLNKHCPDAQILTTGSDISLTHSTRYSELRGLIVATPYPIWFAHLEKSKREAFPILPSSGAFSYYVATRKHLSCNADCLLDDKIWVMANSLEGFLPLRNYKVEINKNCLSSETKSSLYYRKLYSWRHSYVLSGISLVLTVTIGLILTFIFVTFIFILKNHQKHIDIDRKLPLDIKTNNKDNSAISKTLIFNNIRKYSADFGKEFKIPTIARFNKSIRRDICIILFIILIYLFLNYLLSLIEYPEIPIPNKSVLIIISFTSIISIIVLLIDFRIGKNISNKDLFYKFCLFLSIPLLINFIIYSMLSITSITYSLYDSIIIKTILILIFSILVFGSLKMIKIWKTCQNISTEIEGLPIGVMLENLPRLLFRKSRIAFYSLNDQDEIAIRSRIAFLMNNYKRKLLEPDIYNNLKDIILPMERKKIPENEIEKMVKNSREISNYLAIEKWPSRDANASFADTDEGGKVDEGDKITHEAETIVLAMLIHYFNRMLDLVWASLFVLTSFTFGAYFLINSYPLEPEGQLYQWLLLFTGFSVSTIIWVVIGISRNGVIARLNRSPAGLWILNVDLVGKLVGFIAPIITLLAAASLSFSDLFRILFRINF